MKLSHPRIGGPVAYLVDRLIDLGLTCLFSLGEPSFDEDERTVTQP